MKRQSMISALALLVSMAFAAPSQAGTVTVSQAFSAVANPVGNTISSITLTFTGLNGISNLSFVGAGFTTTALPAVITPSGSGQVITLNLAPSVYFASGTISFDTTTSTQDVTLLSGLIKLVGTSVVAGPANITVGAPSFSTAVIPEPTSSAMFGIGIVLAVGLGWGRRRRELAKLAA